MWLFWCLCVSGLLRGEGSVARDTSGELALFMRSAEFSVESTALLNEAERHDREVGFKLRSRLTISAAAAAAANPLHVLLHFTLKEPQLLLRGKHENSHFLPHTSIWNEHAHSEFYAVWKQGVIEKAYLNLADPLDVLNYKKSLISLFQIQNLDGEHNETDISGTCTVLYESLAMDVIRKIKRNCIWKEEESEESQDVFEEVRRVTRYTLSGAGEASGALELSGVHAEELVRAAAPGGAAALKARAWHRLQLESSAVPAPAPLPELSAALLALPPALVPLPLPLQAPPEPPATDQTLESVWEECSASLLKGDAETAAAADSLAADAVLRLSVAARSASAEQVRALLARAAAEQLPALCRALGAAGSAAAHEAAAQFLQLRGDAHAALALDYLAALTLSATPHASVARAALRLAAEARAPALQQAALLAAAALAPRALPSAERTQLVREAREHIMRTIAKCKEERCRTVCLHALGNLGAEGTGVVGEVLLSHAENGTVREALAALDALEAVRAAGEQFERLERLALRGHPALEVRAAAFDLLARAAAPSKRAIDLAPAVQTLQRRRAPSARTLAWQRLEALQERCGHVRETLVRMETAERGWAARAGAGGASGAVERAAGWRARGWAARLDSVQVAAGSLLRRATVRLLLAREPVSCDYTQHFEALNVELWTEGMEALVGSAGDAEPDDEESPTEQSAEPRAGLGYSVGGLHVGGAELFRGQAQLMGHVWAGTAEEPTPALRALLARHVSRTLPLLVGAPLQAAAGGAALFALDAAAQVSLWSRTARTQLRLRAELAARAKLELHSAWARLSAHSGERGAARLHIAADADFYDGVALCVRAATDDLVLYRNASLVSAGGARAWRVSRARRARSGAGAGRTLALGRRNDAACRTLAATHLQD